MSEAQQEARAATLRKFNPGAMQSDDELVHQFVVRQKELANVLEVLRDNCHSSSNEHLLIVAPRGRGKTMLLARVGAELRQKDTLSEYLLPVRFMEENMEVLGVADFWLECLLHLANSIAQSHPEKSQALKATRNDLATLMDDSQLEQRARGAVLDCADTLNRKLVLMVENLQDLANDTDEDFGWQLRKILQNEPRIMLLATATVHFSDLNNPKKPFFELFRSIELNALDTEACRDLWQVATGQEIGKREIRPLEILTGGSPRLLIFIASFARHRSMRQLMEELVTLIDDHTEYFRANLEALAPKERRVYTAVIDLWQASTAKEIAQRARMDIRPVSSLLGRLVNRGAITIEPGEGKAKYYAASERLYSIYYKLRRERNEASVVHGLIRFMLVFFNENELDDFVPNLLRDAKNISEIKQGLKMVLQKEDLDSGKLIGLISLQDYVGLIDVPQSFNLWVNARMKRVVELAINNNHVKALSCLDAMITEMEKSDFNQFLIRAASFYPLYMKIMILASSYRVDEIKNVYFYMMSIYNMDTLGVSERYLLLAGIQRACILATLYTKDSDYLVNWYKLENSVDDAIFSLFQRMFIVLYGVVQDKDNLLTALEENEESVRKLKPLIVAMKQVSGESVRAPKEVLEVAKDVIIELEKFNSVGKKIQDLMSYKNEVIDMAAYGLLLKACSRSSEGKFFPGLDENKDLADTLVEGLMKKITESQKIDVKAA